RTADTRRAPVSGPNITIRWSSPRSGTRSPRASRTSIVPDPRIAGVGAELPALPVEGHTLHGAEVDALEAARIHHVVGRIGARAVERRDAAVGPPTIGLHRAPGSPLRTRIMMPLAHASLVATNSSRLSRSASRDDTLGACPSGHEGCGRRSST